MADLKPFAVTLALTLTPAVAAAWTPYGYGPNDPMGLAPGSPDFPEPGPYPGFDALPPMGPLGAPMGSSSPTSPFGGMRVEQTATADAYLLDIRLDGIKPAEVKVEVRGPWILLSRDTAAQTSQEERFGDGRGYRRSFSYSTGYASRRFNVPPDGDTAAMQRQDADDAVHIAIPRIKPATGQR